MRSFRITLILLLAFFGLCRSKSNGQTSQSDSDQLLVAGEQSEASGNYVLAFHKYDQAADQGNAEAAYHLARLFENGKIGMGPAGSSQAISDAIARYKLSAKLGSYDAVVRLIQLHVSPPSNLSATTVMKTDGASYFLEGQSAEKQGQYAIAFIKYRLAAEDRNSGAAYNIGKLYETGKLGIGKPNSPEARLEALPWYVLGAYEGSSEALPKSQIIWSEQEKQSPPQQQEVAKSTSPPPKVHHRMESTLNFLNQVAIAYNNQNGTAGSPSVAQPSRQGSQTRTSASESSPSVVNSSQTMNSPSGLSYQQGVTNCVAAYKNVRGETMFKNVCAYRVNMVWASPIGHGSLTLGPGDEGNGALSNMSGAPKGDVSYYVCPQFYNPLDMSNNGIKSPVTQYHCVK